MAEKKEINNAYDQVFDFIFSVQKKKVNKPFPKPQPDTDGEYLSALVEIGTQPAIYPLESALDSINSYITKATEIDLGGGVKAGLGSGAFSDSNAYVGKEVAKARAKENFASIGGYLHHGIDGALVSLYAKNNGASAKTSASVGLLFADVKKLRDVKKNNIGKIFGLDSEEDIDMAEENLYKRSVDLLATSLVKSDPRLSKAMILNTIRNGQKIENREDRLRETVERFKMAGLKDPKEGLRVAERIWGKHTDLGVYKDERDYVGEVLKDVSFNGSGKRDSYDSQVRKLSNLEVKTDAQKRSQKNELYKVLKNEYGLEKKEAMLTMKRLTDGLPKQNSRLNIADDTIYSVLVEETMRDALKKGDYETVSRAKIAAKETLENQTGENTLGMRVSRARTFFNWAKDTEGLSRKLLNGEWESFGNEDFNFTQIVKYEKVFDENGSEVGQYIVPAKSVMGSMLGRFYYMHPRNFIKGIFLEGDLLLKWASKWDPTSGKSVVNKKSLSYFLYQARLGKLLSTLKKPFTILSQKILSVVNPLALGLKNFIKNFLVKMLGATGVGGLIVNLLMKFFGDQIAKAVAKITMVVMLGLLGMLVIIADSTGVFYSEDLTRVYTENKERVVENEYDMQNSSGEIFFSNEDLPVIP